MPVLEQPFYHKTITLYTAVFGSVFDEIKISRTDGTTIKVPIAYGVKQKYDVRNTQNPEPTKSRVKMMLPRMSFKLVGLQRDPTRQLSKFHTLTQQGVDRRAVEGLRAQLNRTPYTFQYQLSVKTKHLDDMLQVVEQVMVYFKPSLQVTVIDNPDLNMDSAITIRMVSAGLEDMFEGSFEGEQSLETNFEFELDGYLYMPSSQSKIIKKINLNYFDLDSRELIDTDIVE